MEGDRPFSEHDFHDYVDGSFTPERRLAIATYLVHHPDEAARIEAFRAQKEGMHALFDHVLDQPVPEGLRQMLTRYAKRGARRRRCAWTLAAATVGVGLVAGAHLIGDVDVGMLVPRAEVATPPGARHEPATDFPVIRPPHSPEKRPRSVEI